MLTPEPDGGCYKEEGVETLLEIRLSRQSGIEGRINFGEHIEWDI